MSSEWFSYVEHWVRQWCFRNNRQVRRVHWLDVRYWNRQMCAGRVRAPCAVILTWNGIVNVIRNWTNGKSAKKCIHVWRASSWAWHECCAYDFAGIICIGKIDFPFVGTHSLANPRLVCFALLCNFWREHAGHIVFFFGRRRMLEQQTIDFGLSFWCFSLGTGGNRGTEGAKRQWMELQNYIFRVNLGLRNAGSVGCLASRVPNRVHNCLWCCWVNTPFL